MSTQEPEIIADAGQEQPDALSSSPFEGPEKLLEIWFASSAEDVSKGDDPVDEHGIRRSGLRKVDRATWEEMLKIVQCQVLSVVHGKEIDAYLLSESSMFVSAHRLILKTCGTTLNLLGLPRILSIAFTSCELSKVHRLFYSRKSFMFPERQQGPHREWREEVAFLDKLFGVGHQTTWRGPGSAYTVGSVNRDHWLLYMTGGEEEGDDVLERQAGGTHSLAGKAQPALPDFTIEILMSKLSAPARRPFLYVDTPSTSNDPPSTANTPHHARGLALSHQLGISELFPSSWTTLDAFAFEPCGYSANALVRHDNGEGYFTIHVTPEEGWSYASFECNIPPRTAAVPDYSASAGAAAEGMPDLHSLIQRVVKIFQPGNLSVTLFVSTAPSSSGTSAIETAQASFRSALTAKADGFNYRRTDKINYEFGGYDLAFASFERKGHSWSHSAEWDVVAEPPA